MKIRIGYFLGDIRTRGDGNVKAPEAPDVRCTMDDGRGHRRCLITNYELDVRAPSAQTSVLARERKSLKRPARRLRAATPGGQANKPKANK